MFFAVGKKKGKKPRINLFRGQRGESSCRRVPAAGTNGGEAPPWKSRSSRVIVIHESPRHRMLGLAGSDTPTAHGQGRVSLLGLSGLPQPSRPRLSWRPRAPKQNQGCQI